MREKEEEELKAEMDEIMGNVDKIMKRVSDLVPDEINETSESKE